MNEFFKKERVNRELEGFQSLVSEEELKAIAELDSAAKKFSEVFNHRVDELDKEAKEEPEKFSAMQKVCFSVYSDLAHDTVEKVAMLSVFNTTGTEVLVETKIERGCSWEKMLALKYITGILKED